jgi:hypothetical protein
MAMGHRNGQKDAYISGHMNMHGDRGNAGLSFANSSVFNEINTWETASEIRGSEFDSVTMSARSMFKRIMSKDNLKRLSHLFLIF